MTGADWLLWLRDIIISVESKQSQSYQAGDKYEIPCVDLDKSIAWVWTDSWVRGGRLKWEMRLDCEPFLANEVNTFAAYESSWEKHIPHLCTSWDESMHNSLTSKQQVLSFLDNSEDIKSLYVSALKEQKSALALWVKQDLPKNSHICIRKNHDSYLGYIVLYSENRMVGFPPLYWSR